MNTFAWVNDPEFRVLMNFPTPITEADHWKWYDRIRQQHVFAIEVDGRHVGNCCLKNHDIYARRAELWLYVGTTVDRGHGIGTAALRQLLEFGFEQLDLNRVFLYVSDPNPRAERLYRKMGFKEEGRLRKHLFVESQYRDAIYMGILREEWHGRRTS